MMCSICLNEIDLEDKWTLLPCNHRYHTECIREWFKVNKTCCLCNKNYNTNDIAGKLRTLLNSHLNRREFFTQLNLILNT